MPRIVDMINGPEWRRRAENNQRVAARSRAQSVRLQHALRDSYGMLREQEEHCREANRRTARRSFNEGYGAAVEQVRHDLGMMSIGYAYGRRDGERESRRQIDDRPFNEHGSSFGGDRFGYQPGPSNSGPPRGHGHTGRGGFGFPPSGRGTAPPPWPPHQGSRGQDFYGSGSRGGFGGPRPYRLRSPPNHGRRIDAGRPEWQQQMPGRRQQWQGRVETVYGSESDYESDGGYY